MNAPLPMPVNMIDDYSPYLSSEERGFGALSTARGNLPLQGLSVLSKITGLVAEIEVTQTFVNAFSEPLEATYIFPLPDRAATTGFVMDVAGRRIVGQLKERGEARQEFDDAMVRGNRAAIAEEERPGVFTIRAGNIMPGEIAKITFTLTTPLAFDNGEATFRFPLVVAQRYIPGVPLSGAQAGDGVARDTDAVPDASRISPPVLLPGMPNPVRLSIAVEIDPAGMPLSGVRSTLHAVSHAQGAGRTRIELQHGERLDRDFILRLAFQNDSLVTGAAVCPTTQDEGTFRVTFMPPTSLNRAAKPRDIVFVLDRSGSMGGWKMVAARRAVARMVDTLTSADRFNVLAFDDSIITPNISGVNDLVAATDRNRFAAIEFLAKVESAGGTEMADPLRRACATLLTDSGRERVLVLVTDGQVGNEDQILKSLKKELPQIRVFTVGIDKGVNEGFLRRLSSAGGGAMELVESEDRLDQVMDRIHRKIGTPILTDIEITGEGLDIDLNTLAPDRIAALFEGTPLEVGGRYTLRRGVSLDRAAITIRGKDAHGRAFSESLRPIETQNRAIERVWARTHLRALEDRYAIGNGRMDALEQQIVRVSLQHGVLCRFTAFVAVDKERIVNPGGNRHQVVQAVEDTMAQTGSFVSSLAGMPADESFDDGSFAAQAEMAAPAEKEMQKSEVRAVRMIDADKLQSRSSSARHKKDGAFKQILGKAKAALTPSPVRNEVNTVSFEPAPAPAAAPARAAPKGGTSSALDRPSLVKRAQLLADQVDTIDHTDTQAVELWLQTAKVLAEDMVAAGEIEGQALRKLCAKLDEANRLGSHKQVAHLFKQAQGELRAMQQNPSTAMPPPAPQPASRSSFWKR